MPLWGGGSKHREYQSRQTGSAVLKLHNNVWILLPRVTDSFLKALCVDTHAHRAVNDGDLISHLSFESSPCVQWVCAPQRCVTHLCALWRSHVRSSWPFVFIHRQHWMRGSGMTVRFMEHFLVQPCACLGVWCEDVAAVCWRSEFMLTKCEVTLARIIATQIKLALVACFPTRMFFRHGMCLNIHVDTNVCACESRCVLYLALCAFLHPDVSQQGDWPNPDN